MQENLTEKDINDVFNDILFLEEKVIDEAYEEGYKIGAAQGNKEGYHLGYHRGAEIGSEVGYYLGVTEKYIDNYANFEEKPVKILRSLENLKQLILEFPQINSPEADVVVLKETIERLVNYLEPLLPLANVHMVDFFTKNVYETYLPAEIKSDLKKYKHRDVMDKLFNNDYSDLPNLKSYVTKSQEYTLKNLEVCLQTDSLIQKLSSNCSEPSRLKLNVFMNSKKSHEVDILSYVIAVLKNISGTTHLVDIGDGKGYLSSLLALHNKIPVLGVDASETNTDGSVKRIKKLSKVWNSITSDAAKESSQHLYKQITKYVDENVDFLSLVSNTFLAEPEGLGLIGLHTCGDLAPTCLKLFHKNESIRTICNVGCCYHLLSEIYEEDTKSGEFPMSNYLKEKNLKIGRAARMIAAQSMERILEKKEVPNVTLFYRALLEIILQRDFIVGDKNKQVGRFRKRPANFSEYVEKALKRLNLEPITKDCEILSLLKLYEEREYEVYIFFLLRNMLSPIIESLILLDRLLYLQELGLTNSYIVQFFDPVISPRCYGLVAMK
ncbi:unnamed protein product [Phyllotreta striolata]|uniref:Methyltransferase domain-containing protein n=1 Tax=Phyllotreta striolata TaxID=444603 RepID=A0A9N9TG95_PHYSR|nr:unnamed protein product [Phyllotreta striolata]